VPEENIKAAIQLTRQCLELVHSEDFEQFVTLETERRRAMDKVLSERNHSKVLLSELQQASLALESEVRSVLGQKPTLAASLPYGPEEGPGSYSLLA